MVDYNKRLVEIDEILNYLSEEDLLKIPEEVRQVIKENKDKEYIWKYDISKELKDQDVSRDTIALLSYLNMEYLLNEEQKQVMKQLHEYNEKKLEEAKAKLYSSDDLFKNKHKNIEEKANTEISQENSLIKYKEANFFIKMINIIKNFFRK